MKIIPRHWATVAVTLAIAHHANAAEVELVAPRGNAGATVTTIERGVRVTRPAPRPQPALTPWASVPEESASTTGGAGEPTTVSPPQPDDGPYAKRRARMPYGG